MRGARVRIESKPLEILRELLLRAGNVVSKDELLDSIWGDVTVVEASLPTAVRKLRIALGDGADGRHFIETVSGIGYRFVAPVEQSEAAPLSERAPVAPPVSRTRYLALLAAAGGGLILMAIVLVWRPARVASTPHIHSEGEVKNALRSLDAQAVNRVIADGWDARKTFKAEGSDALSYVIESCEWNPGHDRQKMLMVARALIEAGIPVDRRNAWGDTAYSIAKARRFCGPDHPVTQMIRRICSEGPTPLGDRCMASYQLARGEHFELEAQYKR